MISHLRSMLGRLQSLGYKICPEFLKMLSSRTRWMVFFGILFAGIFALTAFPVQAQLESITNGLILGAAHIMIVVANIAIGLTIFFLRFFIMLASYNNYIDVDVVQLGWIMVRDVANMFFVVALLVIAFGTILGLEEYEWKKNLAKLILAAILINFSNLICQLFIDVAHVFSITFLNAISATAGGNLINMFKLDQITALAGVDEPSGINVELLAAAVPAMMFALMAAAALGSYVYVMAARVVALWALIIFSPLAFIFGVLPKTKSYAEKWWTEFNNNIIVVPIMVFFLWLSFATLGLGNIADQIQDTLPNDGVKIDSAQQGKTEYKKTALSLSKVTTWENMASFLVAFAFLMRGIQETEQTGVTGAGAIGSAVDFAKKVGTIASGYAAGRWLASGAKDMAVTGLKGIRKGAYDLTLANRVERTGNWFKKQYLGIQDWRNAGPLQKKYKAGEAENVADDHELSEADKARGWELRKNEATGKMQRVATKDLTDFERDEKGQPVFRGFIQKRLYMNQLKVTQSRKELEKVQKSVERRQEIMDKSIEAQPDHMFKSRIFGKKEIDKDLDRIEMGILEGMDERSSAKTAQFKNIGRENVLGNKRFKTESAGGGVREAVSALVPIIGGTNLDPRFQNERDTVGEQIAIHKEEAAETEKQIERIMSNAKNRFYRGETGSKSGRTGSAVLEGRVQAELEIKAQEAEAKKLQGAATTRIALAADNDVLARTIEQEKAAHLEEQRLAKEQKAKETEFYKGEHGQAELREEAVLKEQIAASEAEIKKEEAEAKREIAEGTGTGMDARVREWYFQQAQAQKIAATKQASVRESVASSVEKKAELAYQKEEGQADLQKELEAKETIAATEGKLKEVEGKKKAQLATEVDEEGKPAGEYVKQMRERIKAEKHAHFEEEKVKLAQKAAEKDFVESEDGRNEAKTEAAIHAQVSAIESLIKDVEHLAKEMLIRGEFDQGQNLHGVKGLTGPDGLLGDKFSYESTVRVQSESDILQKAVASLETKAKNSAMGQIMADAVAKENEAAKEQFEAGNIHSVEADAIAVEVENLEVEANRLAAEKRKLVDAVQNLLKEKKNRVDQVAALQKRIASEKEKTESDQDKKLIAELEVQFSRAESQANEQALAIDLGTAQEALNTFNESADQGMKLDGLGDKIKVKRIEIEEKDTLHMSDDAEDSTLSAENLRRRTEKRSKLQAAQRERGKNSAWRYAEAKALEEVSNINYQGKHNTLLSDVEQVVVHNKRGISTPTTALTTGIEHYGKTYADTTYEQFVDNMGNSLKMFKERREKQQKLERDLSAEEAKGGSKDEKKIKDLQKKIKEVEITEDDKAGYAGLLIKGQKENWIDDGIWRYMQSSMGPEIQKELGWNDQIFDNKKINDIMALFASGADLEFAKVNSYVTDMMDVATEELGLDVAEFLDKLEKGIFTDVEKKILRENVATTRDGEYNISTDTALIDELLTKDNALVKKYNKTTDDNQAQLQLISGLRDKAAASSHPENGGHAKFIATKDKKFKEVLIGQKMAESSVLGEVKKIGVGSRVAMQSHASIKIDEKTGFSTGTRRKSFRTVRSGATSANDHRGTNERYMLHMAGLSSGDAKTDYATSEGFLVTGKKADGTDSSRFKYIQSGGNAQFRHQKKAFEKAKKDDGGIFTGDGKEITDTDAIERQKVANDVVNNLFADSLLENTPDFLLTMGKMSGIKDQDALNGVVNIKVMVHGQERRITNVNELIGLYNTGAFQWGKNAKPREFIPRYIGGEQSPAKGGR